MTICVDRAVCLLRKYREGPILTPLTNSEPVPKEEEKGKAKFSVACLNTKYTLSICSWNLSTDWETY